MEFEKACDSVNVFSVAKLVTGLSTAAKLTNADFFKKSRRLFDLFFAIIYNC
jgi:hypothetical protein